MLNLIKRKIPKFYSLGRNFKDQFISKKKELNLMRDLTHQNVNNFKSVKNIDYYEYKKKIFEEDKNKKRLFAYLEINNSCNINCVMCDTKSSTRQKKLMDLDTVENQ